MKKRYHILAAVVLKGGNMNPGKCTTLIERGISFIFLKFGKIFWDRLLLSRGGWVSLSWMIVI